MRKFVSHRRHRPAATTDLAVTVLSPAASIQKSATVDLNYFNGVNDNVIKRWLKVNGSY